MLNRENSAATKACKAGTGGPECHNTTDLYNPGDLATARITSDYGRKLGVGTATGGPLARHAVSQFQTPQDVRGRWVAKRSVRPPRPPPTDVAGSGIQKHVITYAI